MKVSFKIFLQYLPTARIFTNALQFLIKLQLLIRPWCHTHTHTHTHTHIKRKMFPSLLKMFPTFIFEYLLPRFIKNLPTNLPRMQSQKSRHFPTTHHCNVFLFSLFLFSFFFSQIYCHTLNRQKRNKISLVLCFPSSWKRVIFACVVKRRTLCLPEAPGWCRVEKKKKKRKGNRQ